MEKSSGSKQILKQGLIIVLLICIIWFFKSLPGWIIEREMEKQLSLIKPVTELKQKENVIPEQSKKTLVLVPTLF